MPSRAITRPSTSSGLADLLLVTGPFAVALAVSIPALIDLSFVWRDSRFYGHGYAIPTFALWLAWSRREALRQALGDAHPPAWGPLMALTAASFQTLMMLGEVGFLAGLGIPLVLGAAAYAVGGRALMRPLLLPLAVVALMVPPPAFVRLELLAQLKLLVTDAAVLLLHLGGQSVLAEGNRMTTPGQTLFVADACSGLTSIVTMLPLACIAAYFTSHGVWRRLVVVASVVPVAIAGNVVRVVATVLMAIHLGPESSEGALHESLGIATYVAGALAVMGLARALR